MYFNHLSILKFKNFSDLQIDLNPGFHFITGLNGSGKTNFLDALYYLCMTRGFRKCPDKLIVQHEQDFFRLEGSLQTKKGIRQVVIKCKPPVLKEVFYDDKKYLKITDHLGKVPVVMIAPDEVYTLINEHEERRKFLNQTLLQIDNQYFEHLYAYNKLLKQRNAALKQMKMAGRINSQLLDALDFPLVQHANYIYVKRKELVENLNPVIKNYVEKISGNKQESNFTYTSDGGAQYAQLLLDSREKDYFSLRTNRGIHKDRIDCLMGEHSLGDLGSQGQIKSFILAMKLAQFNFLQSTLGITPIVLLDDIFAKLDAGRVEKLLALLIEEQISQCFISDTHLTRAQELRNILNKDAYLYQIQDNLLHAI
ncbi:MAG: DNA replication and repair protein RecF [Saprospiraceae bacterium]|nr:DNA replication/repair protein RecF [Saprospiraceae bacterium]